MLTVEERLNNIESGLVAASNMMAELATYTEIDTVRKATRQALLDIYTNLTQLRRAATAAKTIAERG